MSENFNTVVTVKCSRCGKRFEGYKGQKSLCIACFDKESKDTPLKVEKKKRVYKSWTPFFVPKLKEEGKWQDLRITIPGNSETWYKVQKTTDFIGIAIHHTAGPKTQSPTSIALYHINVRGWCFPLETEILTDKGWKDYHEFNLDKHRIAQYENDGSVEFVKASDVIYNEEQEVAHIETGNQSITYSLDHNVYTGSGLPTSFKKRRWGDELEQERGNVVFKVAGMYTGDQRPRYPIEIYQLIAFTVADGYLSKNKKGEVNGICFGLAKERKRKYLENLLKSSGIEYTYHYQKGNSSPHRWRIVAKSYRQFFAWFFDKGEKELREDLIYLPYQYRRAIIDSYIESDGWTSEHGEKGRRTDKYKKIYSISKRNVDILQMLCTLSGMSSYIKEKKAGLSDNTLYVLSITDYKSTATVDLRIQKPSYSRQATWCININNNKFFVRNNGKVQVTFNSGIGYHFLIGQDGAVYYVGDVKTQRAHVANLNHKYIGVCMIGNFTNEEPTDEQLRSVCLLNKELVEIDNRFNIAWEEVKRHNELSSTACPGATWPEWWYKVKEDPCKELREDLKRYKGWLKDTEADLKNWKIWFKDTEKAMKEYKELYRKEGNKGKALEKEIGARDTAIRKLEKRIEIVEKERDNFREQITKETEKLIKERKLWDEKKENFNKELLKQLDTINTQEREIKLLLYIKDSVAYKVGQFIVELIKYLKGGGRK